MSTENNKELYNNSIKILTDLISFKTISGEDNNSLINYCNDILKKLGATSFKTFDSEKKIVEASVQKALDLKIDIFSSDFLSFG